jgi:hypothetical protein
LFDESDLKYKSRKRDESYVLLMEMKLWGHEHKGGGLNVNQVKLYETQTLKVIH